MIYDALIRHSPSLIKYHARLLTLTGDDEGSWVETRVGTEEERMEIDREIDSLEQKLSEVSQWESRVREIAGELGVASKF